MSELDRSVASAERVFAAVLAVLKRHPDLRVGQIIGNVCQDPYYFENDALAERIRSHE